MDARSFFKKNNEKGFTLVEVLASIVILSIILLGVLGLFATTNHVANSNNSRLVAINLGKATLERVKADTKSYFDLSSFIESKETQLNLPEEDNCDVEGCEELYTVKVNDRDYSVGLVVTKDENLSLLDVLVEVELKDENIKHQLEGYVSYATKTEE